jgi:hypothetical protein
MEEVEKKLLVVREKARERVRGGDEGCVQLTAVNEALLCGSAMTLSTWRQTFSAASRPHREEG